MSIIFVLQICYIRNNISTTSFVIIGHTYITLAMTTIALQRLTMPWMAEYRQVIKEFLEKIHLFHKKDESEYANKIYKYIEKICHIFTVFIHIQLYGGILLFNITPWVKNFKAGMYSSNKPVNATYESALYIYLPFDYLTDIKGHIFITFMSWFGTCIGSTSFCLWHLLLSLIVFHIWGNLKILKHNLDNFPKPANHQMTSNGLSCYTEEESKNISTLLVELVSHHRNIMDFMSKTSSAYSFFLLLNFAFYQIVGCIILLECSKLDSEALGNYGPLTVALFQQLIQISVTFELIGSQSETLIDAVYGLPWECMELKNRKLVLFFLQNVQEPISLKACGMISVGVQTMAAILKTCCSYFIMLRTVTANEEMA
ncbi:odorant receptor 10a-like [Cydia amplana]|uniref:odorant receptor 10a-like n=1 Tax=Cydia amplana TaxID=1869771 RepID=UPI002FE5AED8